MITPEYKDELDHERMKAWMTDHGWSTSIGDDPVTILIRLQDWAIEENYDINTEENQ
jgi:hypothetical protein